MIGIGTLMNTGAVIAGGLVGLCLKKGIKDELQTCLMHACGVSSMFIGAAGTLAAMLKAGDDGNLKVSGSMLLILSMVIGTLVGCLLHLETRLDGLGERIKKAVRRENDSSFVEGFVNVSLIICVGAMAIVGSIQDGISGDWSMLAAKSVLDGIIVVVFASTYGVGAVFSAAAIFVYQGAITLLAAFFGSFVSDAIVADMSFVGSALIFCVGINICFGKKFYVGNMLPAILVPVVYEVGLGLIS